MDGDDGYGIFFSIYASGDELHHITEQLNVAGRRGIL